MPKAALETSRRRALAAVLTTLAVVAVATSLEAPATAAPAATVTTPISPGTVTTPAPPATATTPAPQATPAPPVTTTAPPPQATPAPAPTVTTPAPTTTTAVPPPPTAGRAVGAIVPSAGAHALRRRGPLAHAAGTSDVTIRDFSFGPSAVTVHVGDTVTWANAGPTDHTATGAGFDTGILRKGQSGSHTFTSAGTFSYHCTLHPFMKGTITVVAAASGGGTTSAPAAAAPSAAATNGSAATTAAAPATSTSPSSSAALPHTGLDALALAALGALALLGGVLLRRATRSR